mmetsp:Transcript_14334/g.41046  ORF Transcript_14334/g.41046 Transcript_14334/m.41046 type:complete len:110 (-) Transcript_14334:205-534(-)
MDELVRGTRMCCWTDEQCAGPSLSSLNREQRLPGNLARDWRCRSLRYAVKGGWLRARLLGRVPAERTVPGDRGTLNVLEDIAGDNGESEFFEGEAIVSSLLLGAKVRTA